VRGIPACSNSRNKSEVHSSNTSDRANRGSIGGHACRPVRVSIQILWCSSLTFIGERPGTYHVVALSGQSVIEAFRIPRTGLPG
jgi:hypothetical protein